MVLVNWPERLLFADDGTIPNSSLPLLLYRAALPADVAVMERGFAEHGWRGAWRNGVDPCHHFHSVAHEVIGIACGRVAIRFGGPGGRTVRLAAGDVAAIPAGVGHCREEATDDLLVVGAFPDGADWDVCRGDPAEAAQVRANIARVALPEADPVLGRGGLVRLWRSPSPA